MYSKGTLVDPLWKKGGNKEHFFTLINHLPVLLSTRKLQDVFTLCSTSNKANNKIKTTIIKNSVNTKPTNSGISLFSLLLKCQNRWNSWLFADSLGLECNLNPNFSAEETFHLFFKDIFCHTFNFSGFKNSSSLALVEWKSL